jgi:hypothetical protein
MEFKLHPFNTYKDYFCVDIMACIRVSGFFASIKKGMCGKIRADILMKKKHHWKLQKENYMKKREQLISILNHFVIIMLPGK